MILSLVPLKAEDIERIKESTGERVIPAPAAADQTPAEREAADSLIAEAEIIIGGLSVDEALIRKCRNLKWLFCIFAGVEKLPFELLIEKNILVSNVRGIHATQMAEHALGLMIAFSRKLNQFMRNQEKSIWKPMPDVDELTGRTLAIIGAGAIGREIARKAKAFDMRVIGVKKHREPLAFFDEVLDMSGFGEAAGSADYTVLVTPLTPETLHLIGAGEFSAMKKGSVFINLSRGDTVDEEALIGALNSGRLAGAGLDVFHQEPLPAENSLWKMENVIVSPHSAGFSPHYMQRVAGCFIQSWEYYRKGEPIPNTIDLVRRY